MFGTGPSLALAPWVFGVALALAGVAAWTDYRTGHIPNWLTLPPLVIGPLAYGLADGLEGLMGCVLAVVLCGLVPLLMFRVGGMAGGDVKLLAALAAICGVDLALEGEFLTFVVAGLYALGRLAWDGKLFRTLGNVVFMVANPVLPRRFRRPMSAELREKLRLGGAIFAGLGLAVIGRYQGSLFG